MKPLKSQRGAGGIVVILILGALFIGAVWYAINYTKKHPSSSTDLVVPSEQTGTQGGKAIQDAKGLKNKYQPPTNQY